MKKLNKINKKNNTNIGEKLAIVCDGYCRCRCVCFGGTAVMKAASGWGNCAIIMAGKSVIC